MAIKLKKDNLTEWKQALRSHFDNFLDRFIVEGGKLEFEARCGAKIIGVNQGFAVHDLNGTATFSIKINGGAKHSPPPTGKLPEVAV